VQVQRSRCKKCRGGAEDVESRCSAVVKGGLQIKCRAARANSR
jgi:hypothetical protein